jgi:glyoxylase-like metal-dependent hydrolase (beta-lactamase superfamily II)
MRTTHRYSLLVLAIAALCARTVWGDTKLAPGVSLLPGRFVKGTQPDGNTVILRGSKGLLVVDTGRHPEHTQGVIDFANAAHLPVTAIVNSHWHLDHIGGNAMLRKAFPDVRVYASAAFADARKGFLASYRAQLEDMVHKTPDPAAQKPWLAEIALIDAGDALAPDEIVDASGERTLAGRRLRLELEDHAVTAGDLWVLDKATRVLVAGDLVTLPVPFLDTACPERWRAALDRVAKTDFVLLVPGHGAPMHRPQFEVYRKAFDGLLKCAASSQPKSSCIDGWMHDAAPLLTGEDPTFVRSLLDYYVDNSLRGDASRRTTLCGH